MSQQINTVIFDLGGVLIDWNPEYLYRKIFVGNEEKMKWFLENICTPEWNMEQDAGRSFDLACKLLIEDHPEYKLEIRAFFDRWEEMIQGEIKDSVLILNRLKNLNKVKLYALTNWSSETFPIAQRKYSCFNQFEGIVVSGEEKTRKPFNKIYEIILERFNLKPENCLFIDDSPDNINKANKLNFNTIHFRNPAQLQKEIEALGLL
ncbi:HAD family hydrolase [Lutimonas zeaxanthinifaciens]|uniref:HAD family hydrolase n=1 Tax=Lutimonas zeaxanthinifaciens TaxID=3060215 RepID=UPI00265C9CC7|nr:HAD family phosphatase [Lutimonas sp. YSD2104]WKK66927.1 HAD family phosphatase [Lutimonas sp. YSD2104]